MKLCKDCAHCRPHRTYHAAEPRGFVTVDYARARCAVGDVVVGNGSAGPLCTDARAVGGICGPAVMEFEPIPKPRFTRNQVRARWRRIYRSRPWWRFWEAKDGQ